jgi:hypothetical protein
MLKPFKRLIRFITHPLQVTVTEPGPNPRAYHHCAIDLPDALEWLACYPRGTVGFVHSRFGRFIAKREA